MVNCREVKKKKKNCSWFLLGACGDLFNGGRLRCMDAASLFCRNVGLFESFFLLLVLQFNLFRHFLLFVYFFIFLFTIYLFQRWALKALESIHASGRLVSRSEECVQPLTQVCQKQKKKLHAAAFTSRSTKPRLASYWEAVWLIRRRLVQSGRSAETQGGVWKGWGSRGGLVFTSKQGDERHGKPAHAASQDREESPRRCHTLKGIFNRDLFAPLASLYRT